MPRTSDAAVERNRIKARERAQRLRHENREEVNRQVNKWRANNRESLNEQRRLRYGIDMDIANRPFIFWDGEGYTTGDGAHHYMLFGCSHFPDDPIVGPDLSSKACLDYILFV